MNNEKYCSIVGHDDTEIKSSLGDTPRLDWATRKTKHKIIHFFNYGRLFETDLLLAVPTYKNEPCAYYCAGLVLKKKEGG